MISHFLDVEESCTCYCINWLCLGNPNPIARKGDLSRSFIHSFIFLAFLQSQRFTLFFYFIASLSKEENMRSFLSFRMVHFSFFPKNKILPGIFYRASSEFKAYPAIIPHSKILGMWRAIKLATIQTEKINK